MRLLVLVLLGLAACEASTPAIVTSVSDSTMTTCQVALRWSRQQLEEACGAPRQEWAWRGQPQGECLYYSTTSGTFSAGLGPRGYAVCLSNGSVREVYALQRVEE